MSDLGWVMLKNIVLLCLIAFLIWQTETFWPALGLLFITLINTEGE